MNGNWLSVAVLSLTLTQTAGAAVSPEEAKQLGGPVLTVFGAEKAGNKEGTIPEYLGKSIKAPVGYDPKGKPGYYPDPWNEKPSFSITAQNYVQHADKLDNLQEMFKKFPNFRMDVYPSHRTWVLPQSVLDNSIKNATSCKAVSNELKLEGCFAGVPFPIPKTGAEMMWNHLTSFEANAYESYNDNYIVPFNGPPVLNAYTLTSQQVPFFRVNGQVPSNTIYWEARVDDFAPARRVGNKLVVIDSLDLYGVGRRAWSYIPGQRRVKLAPDLAYDTPSPFSGGSATMDDQKAFLGSFDRYELKLKGKKEKYITYNNFKITDKANCPTEKLIATKGFPNPECLRWELHRVWMLEANLKAGYRHIYKKRYFYFDEDAPGTGLSENFDSAGNPFRMTITANYPFFDQPGGISGSTFFSTDLQTGLWALAGGSSCEKCTGWYSTQDRAQSYYSPEALAGEGIR